MLYQLPPVGNRVQISAASLSGKGLDGIFSPYSVRYFNSGTSALAAALISVARMGGMDRPEVLLPAYGCPDLVSAAQCAGMKPVLVDLEADRPWMNLERLAAQVTERAAAIIAVDLFGIPERLEAIREIARKHDIVVIEDSAQGFPVENRQDYWGGDVVVLSFGRGKPVSLLGGGAILFRDAAFGEGLPKVASKAERLGQCGLSFRLKAALYNRMIHPRLYWLPQSMPFLHLGETRYHPLDEIMPLNEWRRALLPANIAAYRESEISVQQAIQSMLAGLDHGVSGLVDLAAVCNMNPQRRLLRYPLLVHEDARGDLVDRLGRAGLGASIMYPAILPAIKGLESLLASQGPFPEAEEFSKRIITLPTHNQVQPGDIDSIARVIRSH